MSELEDDIKGVKGWLDKQGYPLEMAVAKVLKSHGMGFIQGYHYEDPDTNQMREIDVLSSGSYVYGNNALLLQAIIECKYSKNPIVAFTYPSDLKKSPVNSWVPCNPNGRNTLNKIIANNRFSELPIFYEQNPIAYSLKQSQIEREGKSESKDAAFDAIMSVVKASYALSKLYTEKVSHFPTLDRLAQQPSAYIGIPTIVIKAPLFICYLDKQDQTVLEPRSSVLLEITYPKVGLMMIRVIQETEVAKLASDIMQSVEIITNRFLEYV